MAFDRFGGSVPALYRFFGLSHESGKRRTGSENTGQDLADGPFGFDDADTPTAVRFL